MENIRFCQKMLTSFDKKEESILNLVIALAGNQSAHSPTELALNPLYKYQYSSISDAIDNFLKEDIPKGTGENPKVVEEKPKTLHEKTNELNKLFKKEAKLRDLVNEFFPKKYNDKFWVLNTDVTSIYREHSPTLADKEFVHMANSVIKDNKPVTIGHRLSTVGLNARENGVAWNPPISMLKVPLELKSSEFAAQQIKVIIVDEKLFNNDLVINNLDSAYNNVGYAYPTYEIANLISIIRMAGNRNVFNCYTGDTKTGSGAKNKYGEVFKLPKKETHRPPDKTEEFDWTMKNNRKCNINVRQWNNMILKGKRNKRMHDKPFNLVAIQLTDIQTGKPVFKNTLWVAVWGERRNEITLREIYESFRLRFDIEFFFRFGKQKLLLDKYQTPDVAHEQNWFWIVFLSYWLLYLSRTEGENIIRPWEKYLPKCINQDVKELENNTVKTPTQPQRALPSILCDFTKNNLIPKTHNNRSGREKGKSQTPRKHFNPVKKGVKLQI